jgi:hypothetical protein
LDEHFATTEESHNPVVATMLGIEATHTHAVANSIFQVFTMTFESPLMFQAQRALEQTMTG